MTDAQKLAEVVAAEMAALSAARVMARKTMGN